VASLGLQIFFLLLLSDLIFQKLCAGVYGASKSVPSKAVFDSYNPLIEYFERAVNEALNQSQTTFSSSSAVTCSGVRFKGVPIGYEDDVQLSNTLSDATGRAHDLVMFMPPYISSCAASYGFTHLVTAVYQDAMVESSSEDQGSQELAIGGMMFTRAGNTSLESWDQIRGKIVISTS
jgi:hypothetical protein